MANLIAKTVSKRLLKEHAGNNFGKSDPMYERIEVLDVNGRPTGKVIKQKKPIPPGISKHDEKILNKVRRRAHRLDESFNICGIKFGVSSIVGLIPGLGDIFDVLMAMMVLNTCRRVEGGLDKAIGSKMVMNIVIDAFIGVVPFFGDIADALFKCNSKNAILLDEFLTTRGKANLAAMGSSGHATDQTPRQRPINQQPIRTDDMKYSGPSKGRNDNSPPRYQAAFDEHNVGTSSNPTPPQPAKLGKKSYGDIFFDKYKSWRGGQRDLEKGEAAPPQLPRH